MTRSYDPAPQPSRSASLVGPLAVGLIVAIAHLVVAATTSFDYFRDELYYLACASHPAAGYVDHPPFSIWVLALVRALIGDSLLAIRLVPALASGATTFVVGALAREMGGSARAATLAAIVTACVPVQRAMASYYSMNAIDILVWPLAAWLLVRAIDDSGAARRRWIWLGIVLGIGVLNKISVLWFGAGLGVALLVEHRHLLRSHGPWLAAGIALAALAPFAAWNAAHDFAHLEFMRNAVTNKYASQTVRTFLVEQVMQQLPLSAPVWLAGLWFYFIGAGTRFRALGWIFIVTLAVLIVNGHSKAEYMAPAYTLLFAGGTVAIEGWLTGWRRHVTTAYAAVMVASLLLVLPVVVPMLDVERTVTWTRALGLAPSTSEGKALGRLGQFFADMLGWRDKAEAVARVYRGLSPSERERAAIFANNYGRAAAVDHYGAALGLPPAIGNHNNYWIWGPRGATGAVVIILGGDVADHRTACASVVEAARVTCRDCMPYESDLGVFVCRGTRRPIADAWRTLKHYD